ncbi:DNA lyase [Candidatus Pacearchaeota archaeon]|nr:DNA lyase [Candidatus Pacearchaeota archaeon]
MESIIKESYAKHETAIKIRLQTFKNLPEKEWFEEFCFCLLTPQSNAQRCWQAVEQLKTLKNPTIKNIAQILSTKTRFHNTKAAYIHQAPETWQRIKPLLSSQNSRELRNLLAQEVKGYGLKEASHFLRNIGKSHNQIAILDRHILKNLYKARVIPEPSIKGRKQYYELEKSFLDYAQKTGIPADELDLLWWSQENGQIFK